MDIDEEARAPPEQTVNNSSLGETENPTGTHNDGLDTALMAINDNMGSIANLLGRLCARLDAGADNNTRSNHPTGSQRATGRKRQRSRSPHSSSEVHSEDEAATEDRLSVKASEDELEALVGGNNNPDKAGNINESEDSLLKELETAIQEEEKKGPKIRQQLADIALKRWGKKLRQEKLSGTLDKHYPPENCSDMNVPRINPEIWAQLNAFKKKADLRLANMQQTLQRATSATLAMCDKVLSLKDTDAPAQKEIIGAGVDTIALLGHVGADLSGLRREQIKPALKQEFHALCFKELEPGPSKLLFGEDLAKQIRDAKETTRIGNTVGSGSRHDRKYNNKGRREAWDNKSYNSYKPNGGKRQPFLWKGFRQNVRKKFQSKPTNSEAK